VSTAQDRSIEIEPIDMGQIFSPECILTISSREDKAFVLTSLVELLARKGRLPRQNVDGIVSGLLERERLGTTGLGKGLALPHLRSRALREIIAAVGVAPAGVDFKSLDRAPTRLIVLVLSPFEEREKHLEVMGRLATLLSDKTLQYSLQIPRSPNALLRFLGVNNL